MIRIRFRVAGLLAALVAPSRVWADSAGGYHGPDMMWHGGWYGMFLGPLMMIVIVAAIVVVVVLVVRWLGGSGHGGVAAPHGPAAKAPLDILKERFARGEIDKEEFEERKRILSE